MSDDLDFEQRVLDISDDVKEAVVVLSQGIADLAEKLSGTGKIEEVLAGIEKQLAAAAKSAVGRADSAKPIADAIVQALKGLTIQAPDVVVNVAPPVIKLPEQAAPTVNIQGAKHWEVTHAYDPNGRLTGSTLKRIA